MAGLGVLLLIVAAGVGVSTSRGSYAWSMAAPIIAVPSAVAGLVLVAAGS